VTNTLKQTNEVNLMTISVASKAVANQLPETVGPIASQHRSAPANISGFSRRRALGGGALLAASTMICKTVWAQDNNASSGFATIDGLKVYFEVYGGPLDAKRTPLVLLHGGAVTIERAFTPELIARFLLRQPVLAIEQQGHGHTADRPENPMTIDRMVEDTAGVLNYLGVQQADFLGHSLGGIIGTGVAIRHPVVVRNLTTLGSPYSLDGFLPEIVRMQRDPTAVPSAEMVPLLPTESDVAAWRASFEHSAPDPTAFDAILARLNKMLADWPGWTDEQLRAIRVPVLLVVGDNDYVRIDHAVKQASLIPNARLAVLPGTTHLRIVKRDAWFEPMMEALNQPPL
jgi:pimeloyl-ACP methyl ester carboxylesterase